MDTYRTIAPIYDAVTSAFLKEPRRLMVETCVQLGVRRILDVGCGTGILTAQLSRCADMAAGLDISAAMLRKTTGKTGGQGSPLFLLADGTALPFVKNSFDMLTYALVLHESASCPEELLRRGFSLAPLALVLEWRLPERNSDHLRCCWAHIVERLAGHSHYRHFRSFMRAGGLKGLAQRSGASLLWEQPLKGGCLVLALLLLQ